LKISDLGLARIVKIRKEGDLVEGDSRYMAGELLNYRPGMDLTKADIFSLAITIYEGITL
jgi:serine/threonine protein kinase